MSHQYSRTEAQYDYCGEKLNRHNIKAHTDSKHKGLPVKERFKTLRCTLCGKESDKYETTRYSLIGFMCYNKDYSGVDRTEKLDVDFRSLKGHIKKDFN